VPGLPSAGAGYRRGVRAYPQWQRVYSGQSSCVAQVPGQFGGAIGGHRELDERPQFWLAAPVSPAAARFTLATFYDPEASAIARMSASRLSRPARSVYPARS
jgi:hypothetical protein